MIGPREILATLLALLLGGVSFLSAQPELIPPPRPLQAELSVDTLVEQVLARNPSLAQMTAAWQAASARYPQAVALEDPMFTAWVGPGSIGSRDVDFAYRLELSQKLPFPGKRGLKGQSALMEASAAGREVDDMRLQLIESARAAYYEYYLVERVLEVNAANLRLLRDIRANAVTRLTTGGMGAEQEVLQTDVEIGRQRERQVTLERMRKVAVARINTLMHQPPDVPLLPTPRELRIAGALPEAGELRAVTLTRRPDLQALSDRLAADQAALALACKEFYPDFEIMAAYDRFWQGTDRDLQPQIAVRMNLPVRKSRRWGAIAEAQAKVAQRRAELDRQIDQINLQVQEAYEQVRESEQMVRLYTDTILPTARRNVETARSGYVTAKIPFLNLNEAQRNQVMLNERYYEIVADYFRRRAALERAIGGPIQ